VDKLQGQCLGIARAKESPGDVATANLPLRCEETERGYQIHVGLRSSILNGFDPEEFPKLGFFYEFIDYELGTQTLSAGSEMKYAEDPSCWVQLAIES
jgi:hypothetical protein